MIVDWPSAELLDPVVAKVIGEIDAAITLRTDATTSFLDALRAIVDAQVQYFGTQLDEAVEFLEAGQSAGEFRSFDAVVMADAPRAAFGHFLFEWRRQVDDDHHDRRPVRPWGPCSSDGSFATLEQGRVGTLGRHEPTEE